jgi:hypothetical protein
MGSSDDERTNAFLESVPSFSLIYFTGDVYEQIPAFLIQWGYSILGQADQQGSFLQVFNALGRVGNQRIVHKAVYRVAGGTVLLDPEMVMGVSRGDLMDQFCSEHEVETVVAIWERVSETVIAVRRSGQALLVDACFVRGEPQKPLINAPPDLVQQPSPASLKSFLVSIGAPVGQIFGSISAVVYRLDEANMRARGR